MSLPAISTPRLDNLTKPATGKPKSLYEGLEFIRPITGELSLKWLGNSMLGLFDRLDKIIKPEKPSSDLDKEKSLQVWNLDWLMLRQLFKCSQTTATQMKTGNNLFTALEPLSKHDEPADESQYNSFDDLVEDCAKNIRGNDDQEALIKTLSIFKKCKLDAETVALFQEQSINPLVTFAKAMTLIVDLDAKEDQSSKGLAQVLKTALFMEKREHVSDVLPVLLAIGQVLQRVHDKRGKARNTPMDKLLTVFDLAINRLFLGGKNEQAEAVLLEMGEVATRTF
jgi:hypothetical protein